MNSSRCDHKTMTRVASEIKVPLQPLLVRFHDPSVNLWLLSLFWRERSCLSFWQASLASLLVLYRPMYAMHSRVSARTIRTSSQAFLVSRDNFFSYSQTTSYLKKLWTCSLLEQHLGRPLLDFTQGDGSYQIAQFAQTLASFFLTQRVTSKVSYHLD